MSSRKRLGLWGAGMAGVVAVSVLVLPALETPPQMIGRDIPQLPVPMWVLVLASIFKSAIYLAGDLGGGCAESRGRIACASL